MSRKAQRVAGAQARRAAHRKEEHEERERDRPDEGDPDFPVRKDQRHADVHDLPEQPDDQAVSAYPSGMPSSQPASASATPSVVKMRRTSRAGCADAAADADLARALEHVRGDSDLVALGDILDLAGGRPVDALIMFRIVDLPLPDGPRPPPSPPPRSRGRRTAAVEESSEETLRARLGQAPRSPRRSRSLVARRSGQGRPDGLR